MANPLVCIFNPITTLIDQIPSQSAFTGASAAGSPVVLNSLGVIDPSFLGQGLDATAGELLVAGALVNLYNNGGTLFMQNAYAAATGTAPSGHAYPVAAVGFVANNTSINNSSLVLFSGTFTYADPNSEFTANNIGDEVYLRATPPKGGVTLTAPSGAGQLSQSIGNVVGFTAPNFVLISYVASPQPPFSTPGGTPTNLQFNKGGGVFGGVPGSTADGTNGLLAIAPTGTGVALTVTGDAHSSNIQNWYRNGFALAPALFIDSGGNLNLSEGLKDSTGSLGSNTYILSSTGTQTMWVPVSSSASFSAITTGTNTSATMTVGSGSSIVVSGSGVVEATQIQAVVVSATPPAIGQVLTATGSTSANWQTPSGGGTPGGSNTQVQYNNSGTFAGSPQFIWDTTLTTSAFAPALAIGNNIAGGPPFPNSRINVVEQFTTTTPQFYSAYQCEIIVNGSGDFTGTDYVGYEATFGTEGSANYGSAAMWQGSYTHESSGTIQDMIGVSATLSSNAGTAGAINGSITAITGNASPGGNAALAQGGSFTVQVQGGTTTIAAGVEVVLVNSGTITTGYGVKVDPIENAGTTTTYYGLWTGPFSGTQPTNYFSLYLSDGAAFFGGTIQDGTHSVGTSGQALLSTGSGVVWGSPSAGAGGSPTQIQYNLSGSLAGISGSAVTTLGGVTLAPADSSVAGLAIVPTAAVSTTQGTLAVVSDSPAAPIFTAWRSADYPSGNPSVKIFNGGGLICQPQAASTIGFQAVGAPSFSADIATFQTNDLSSGVSITPYAQVVITPEVGSAAPALLVNDDGGGTNDLADFFDSTNNYNVVAISQPNNTGSTAAITVNGDSNGDAIAGFFVNAATAFTAGTGVTIDSVGDLTLVNTTPATGLGPGNSFPSPNLSLSGTYWNGSTSVTDGWNILDDTTNMSGPRLTFTYTGSQTSYGIMIPQGTSTQPSLFFGSLGTGISGLAPGPQDAVCIFGGQLVVNETGGVHQVYLSASGTSVLGTSVNGGSPGSSLEITTNQYAPTAGGFGISLGGMQPANTSGVFSAIELGTTATNPIEWSPVSGAGTFNALHVQAQINQTGSASGSYTGIALNVVETALLGTNNLLLSLNAGALGTTNKFYVDNSGDTVMVGYVMSSGVVTAITTKTGTYTATDTDHTINCNGTFTLNLPTTSIQVGQEYYIKNIGSGTITVSSTVNIDFATSLSLTSPGQSVTVQWDGTQYWIY